MHDIKIFVACHEDSYVPQSEVLVPIQVGAALTHERFQGMITDDTGENISHKNKCFCELTAHYWAWKNCQADYYGFYHYRRYISLGEMLGTDSALAEISYLTPENLVLIKNTDEAIQRFVPNYDIITIKPRCLNKSTIWMQYEKGKDSHEIQDLAISLEIIKELWPEYYDTAFHYFHSNQIYYCNMFIARKEIFESYSEWLFCILNRFLERKNIDEYNPSKFRVAGYLAERLWGFFIFITQNSIQNGNASKGNEYR